MFVCFFLGGRQGERKKGSEVEERERVCEKERGLREKEVDGGERGGENICLKGAVVLPAQLMW